MEIKPLLVILPLTSSENTIGRLISEIRFQEKQRVVGMSRNESEAINQFLREIEKEILRRFEELEKRTTEAEKNLLRAIERCNVLEQTIRTAEAVSKDAQVMRYRQSDPLAKDDLEFRTAGSGAN